MGKRYICAVLLLLIVAGFVRPDAVTADESHRFDMNVNAGLDGKAQEGKGFPVHVTMKNNGEDFSGDLVVTIPTDTGAVGNLVIPVALAAGAEKTFSFPVSGMQRGFFQPHGRGQDLQPFRLYEGGWKDGKEVKIDPDLTINPGFLPQDRVLIGILANDPDALNHFKLPQLGQFQPTVIQLDEEDIPDSSVALEVLDVLVINDYAVSALPEDAQRALKEWVYAGGRLIIGSTPGMMQQSGTLADLLPFTVTGEATVDSLSELEKTGKAPLNVKNFEIMTGDVSEGAKPVYQQEGHPLLVQADAGKGSVCQYTFDLGHPAFAEWKGIEAWWQSRLDRAAQSHPQAVGPDPANQLSRMSGVFPSMTELPFAGLLLLLIAYIVIVVPFLYVLLKKFDKREWSWVVIPVISVVFSVGLFVYGAKDRLGAVQTNAVSIVTLDENGTGSGVSSVSMLSQHAGDYVMDVEKRGVFPEQEPGPFRAPSLTNIPMVERGADQAKVHYENVEFWSPRTLSVQLPVQDFGGLASDLTFADGKITGELTNRSPYDFHDITLLSGSKKLSIGELKAGETKTVSLKMTSAALFRAPQLSQTPRQTGQRPSQQNRDEWKKEELMQAAGQTDSFDFQSPVLTAYTTSNLYSVNVNGKATDQTNLSLFIQPADIQLPENGRISFETDINMPELSAVNGDIHFTPMMRGGEVFGATNGTYELRYPIPNMLAGRSYSLQSVTVQLQNRSGSESFEIYHPESAEFEPLDDGTEFTFRDNPEEHVVHHGAIRIRVHKTSGDPEVRIPLVTIEGVSEP